MGTMLKNVAAWACNNMDGVAIGFNERADSGLVDYLVSQVSRKSV
jgi:hypothetical protein